MRTVGLTIPQTLLLQATQKIESPGSTNVTSPSGQRRRINDEDASCSSGCRNVRIVPA